MNIKKAWRSLVGLKKPRRISPRRMLSLTITSISLEKDLLDRVRGSAAANRQSVSQWFTDAAYNHILKDHEHQ